jgi:outer membrane protein assembly factor BamB
MPHFVGMSRACRVAADQPVTRHRCAPATRVALVLLGAAMLVPVAPAHAYDDGISGYSGKQGETCQSQCHDGGVKPLVQFEGPRQVAPGETATFRFVVHSQAPAQMFAGFDVAASDGVLGLATTEDERLDGDEVTHTQPKPNDTDGTASWQFTWRAPMAAGPRTLYGAGNSVNGDDTRDGDASQTTQYVVDVTGDSDRGDANCDGVVSAADLTTVALGVTGDGVSACGLIDVDCDGTITADDLTDVVTSIFEPPGPACNPGAEWTTLGQNQQRTYFNSQETRITRDNVGNLRFKWRYLTGAIVTASPTVAWVDVPNEGHIKIVYVASWDGNFYALRAANGSELWHYTMKPHPGAAYPYAASAEVTTVAGEQRVFVAGGMTVYSLAAATGALRWEFDAGTGCTTCDAHTERNEVESSPAVVGDLVYFALDTNDSLGKGGVYAVSAVDGRLVWYFDPETYAETEATCRPFDSDNVRRFDGFHTATQLGLPDDFFATRPGCNFDRTPDACGNIWSSFAVDPVRRLIYTTSSNCDTDNDPATPKPPPPMPPYDEAIFALTLDGAPAWVWRPREVDNADLDFGAVPNLFQTEVGGVTRDVVGVGGKDGTYYLLDRDGVNALTGHIEPYWSTTVVPGSAIGGIIASAAVGDDSIFFSTAAATPGTPAAFSLGASDGMLRWSNSSAKPSYGPTTGIPGVVFMGGVGFSLVAYDADSGAKLKEIPLGVPVASGAAVVGGEVFVGAGTGARGIDPTDAAYKASVLPSYISALCLPDAANCPATMCDDGDACTYDFHSGGGCRSEPAPDGLPCLTNGRGGSCVAGTCQPR